MNKVAFHGLSTFLRKYWLRLLVVGLIVVFFGQIVAGMGRHQVHTERYLAECHAKNGVRVQIRDGVDWVCLKREAVIDMGDLESPYVIHPSEGASE